MFSNMEDVKEANKSIGHHWFDKESMAFFNSRIESELQGGKYFISSEKYEPRSFLFFGEYDKDEYPRLYTVHSVNADGSINTEGEFQQYKELEVARKAIKELLAQGAE